jgi:LysM repeat protein
MLKATDSSAYGVFVSGTFYPMSKDMFETVKASTAWRFAKSAGTLSAASLAKTTKGSALTPFIITDNVGYLLSAAGKTEIADIQNVVNNPTSIPAAVTTLIDRVAGDALSTPLVVKSSNTATTSYYVANRLKRPSFDTDEGIAISALRSNSTVKIWPSYAIDAIASGSLVIAPGTLVKVKESGNIYIIDGWSRGLRVTTAVANSFGSTALKTVTRANLAGYNTLSTLPWQKVTCAGVTYLVDSGKLTRIDTEAISQWPGTAVALDATTCSRYQINAAPVGVFVSNGTAKYKLISGKLKPIRTAAEYTTMLGNGVAAASVSKKLITELPKLNPTSYVVVKGDTLYKVAVKFGVTRAQLRQLNNLTTDVLTIGQVIKLP